MSTPNTADRAPAEGAPGHTLDSHGPCAGVLHIHVAFDWGDSVDLAAAHRLVPAAAHALPRRRRTPSSIEYRPLPLRLSLSPVAMELPEIGEAHATGDVTIFDFAAVSVALHVPFHLAASGLSHLANHLATPESLVQMIRQELEPLYNRLLPAIDDAAWSPFSEEYFVLQIPPGDALPDLSELFSMHADWLASLVHLDSSPLSREEVEEALRLRISYTTEDLFVADWPAAVLIDRDCDETLQIIEFANVQLLEYRNIDDRLDKDVSAAYRLIHGLRRSSLPFWRTQARPLRKLGDLQVEATDLFERTGNVLKLVGDQYLARVYRVLDRRFHLDEWEASIRRKLEVLEVIYKTLSDQAATYRAEFLEAVVVILILLEIVMAFFRH
jgi:hypothetical protein